jgi:hypothetical protein
MMLDQGRICSADERPGAANQRTDRANHGDRQRQNQPDPERRLAVASSDSAPSAHNERSKQQDVDFREMLGQRGDSAIDGRRAACNGRHSGDRLGIDPAKQGGRHRANSMMWPVRLSSNG